LNEAKILLKYDGMLAKCLVDYYQKIKAAKIKAFSNVSE